MARKSTTDLSGWASLTLEGNLIAPAMVTRIDSRQATEQSEEDYHIRKGLSVREEISTAFRVGQSHFDDFTKIEHPSQAATQRFVRAFLAETFGFDDLVPADDPISFLAGNRVPVAIVPPSEDNLDRRSPTLSTDRSRSPALALQDYLNAHEEALWGLVTNGTMLRLMRDNDSLTRSAYIEADLAAIFTNEDAASFAALWLLVHRTRFGVVGAPATDCALERWREAGAREGEAARDRLAAQVETALKVLGSGFLEANPELSAHLRAGDINLLEWFNELLRLVYRLIFLMVAEDRNLLHPETASLDARKLYAEGYSLAVLRAQAIRRAAWDRHHDRYEGIKIVFRALAHGEEKLGLPALGGLFSADRLPHLETARLRNRAFMDAIYQLGWLSGKTGKVPVNWQAMQTEELGSVYESLLELQPQLGDDGKTLAFASETAEKRGNQRKATGSYYTPDSLVQLLLDTTLDPVLDRAETQAANPAEALLNLTVIDPACGSGHFLLAASRRIATRVARHRADGLPSMADYRHALREVASRCLYGVDRNPMAVELSKVALWIEALEPGRPLAFFDAQMRCGDSLIGVFDRSMLREGIPDEAYKPLTGDDRELSNRYKRLNKEQRDRAKNNPILFRDWSAPEILAERDHHLRGMSQDSLAEVEAKARNFGLMRQSDTWRNLKTASDLYLSAGFYMAAFFAPKTTSATSMDEMPLTEHVWHAAAGSLPPASLDRGASLTSEKISAFHWFIEFPEIMERDGGFDIVIGNPPWDVSQLNEKEFFAARAPEIAELAGDLRKEAITRLEVENPRLWNEFELAKRVPEAANTFFRSSGRFSLTAIGKLNTYSLFAELFSNLAKSDGRAGVIVPTGIATDSSTSVFFGDLISSRRLTSLVDFENRKGLFPAVDSRMKFCVLSIGPAERASFAFFLTDPVQLAEPERRFTLTPEEIARINPNTQTAPVFRSRADAELTSKLYNHAPVLVEERSEEKGGDVNPWGISFQQGLFNMTSDSGFFLTPAQMEAEGWRRNGTDWVRETEAGPERRVPLYEAKMIHQFDHRWATYGNGDTEEDKAQDCTLEEKQNPDFEPSPRYWVPEEEVNLRAARVPSALKSAIRMAQGNGGRGRRKAETEPKEAARSAALKALVTWLAGAIPALEGHPAQEADITCLIGRNQDWRGAFKASLERFLIDPRTVATGQEMQRETPLFSSDLILIAEGSDDALELAVLLVTTKQPRWLMGWRDITNATNERTVIASVFPKVGVGHTMPLFFLNGGTRTVAVSLAMWSSLIFDFIARLSVGGTHLTYSYLKQFAALPPNSFTNSDLDFIVPRVLELTYTSCSMKLWAEDLGYSGPPFAWNESRRVTVRAELDAFFARKYGLTRDELRYILDPADVKGTDYPSETFRVLKDKEIRQFGEYRTRRIVLEAWDRMEASQAPKTPPVVEIPLLRTLRNHAWAWRSEVEPRDRLRYAAQYALWQADPVQDGTALRFVIACLAEPALLTPHLPAGEQAQWIRLMGSEARSRQDVVRLRSDINAAWRSMFQTMITSGQLEERADGSWVQGRDFSPAGLRSISPEAQRTAFVLDAVRAMNVGQIEAETATEDNVIWMRFDNVRAA